MASPRFGSSGRICRRYKLFFYLCFLIFGVQIFIGFKFYTTNYDKAIRHLYPVKMPKSIEGKNTQVPDTNRPHPKDPRSFTQRDSPKRNLFNCTVLTKEAESAYSRAKTDTCKRRIREVACLNLQRALYPPEVPYLCPHQGDHEKGRYMGCYRDNQKDRDLDKVHTDFPKDNTVEKCINFCLTGSYRYAGVQYGKECWCGDAYGKHGDLAESLCSTPCNGNYSQKCGGYNTQRIFSTGLPLRQKNGAFLVTDKEEVELMKPVRIVFVLTVNGRAVRQVLRLLKRLYHTQHYYFIHVDSRSVYMYRELLKLEETFPNIRLARRRFATIWGGASLLQAHVSFIQTLLQMKDWAWDYYLNLSESDYPIKDVDSLTLFLTKYKGNNFLKANGRDTHGFIKKQGIDQLFFECENHLWRLGRRDLPRGIRIEGGSDWIVLHRDFCLYSVSMSDKLLQGLHEFYRFSLLPVESFFHTLLMNSKHCGKWVDNNLHMTNWNRKKGCKCQHKHQVDWCGCSPVDIQTADLDKLNAFSSRATFFARKFEPIVNQEILDKLDSQMGVDISEVKGQSHYWQNEFHYLDGQDKKTDLILSFGHSFARRTENIFKNHNQACQFTNIQILETHVLYALETFYGYLVKFNVTLPGSKTPYTVESQYSKQHHYTVLKPYGPFGKLKNMEVGTDYDLKEEIFRNYPRMMNPSSDLVLRYEWGSPQEDVLSVAWVDPAGEVAAVQDLKLNKDNLVDHLNAKLRTPLRPGVWTVKLMHKAKVGDEVKFLVLPFDRLNGTQLTQEDVMKYNNGPKGPYSVGGLNDMRSQLGIRDEKILQEMSVINGKRVGAALNEWIDSLTFKFWKLKDACSVQNIGPSCSTLELCKTTRWSSVSPDPKSEFTKDLLT